MLLPSFLFNFPFSLSLSLSLSCLFFPFFISLFLSVLLYFVSLFLSLCFFALLLGFCFMKRTTSKYKLEKVISSILSVCRFPVLLCLSNSFYLDRTRVSKVMKHFCIRRVTFFCKLFPRRHSLLECCATVHGVAPSCLSTLSIWWHTHLPRYGVPQLRGLAVMDILSHRG